VEEKNSWCSDVGHEAVLRLVRREALRKRRVLKRKDPPGATRCRQCSRWAPPCTRCFFRWCDEGLFAVVNGDGQDVTRLSEVAKKALTKELKETNIAQHLLSAVDSKADQNEELERLLG
jgi:hypothetical protein